MKEQRYLRGRTADLPSGGSSAQGAQRVRRARGRALGRQGCANNALAGADIGRLCRPEGAVRQLLHAASHRLGWSARAYHRVLKVARTIADLDDAAALDPAPVPEAIQYRRSLREN